MSHPGPTRCHGFLRNFAFELEVTDTYPPIEKQIADIEIDSKSSRSLE